MIDINKEILKCLKSIEEYLPAPFPRDEYMKEVSRYGRKRLVETLVREACLRYQAETSLIEYGFRQNRAGKWVKDCGQEIEE